MDAPAAPAAGSRAVQPRPGDLPRAGRGRGAGRWWLIVPVLPLFAACSAFLPKFQTPHLSVAGISVGHSDLFQQHLTVRMHVENPNDRALPVQGLSYVLMLSGEQVAQGSSQTAFVVPARGSADFDMGVTANLASALVRIFGKGSSGPIEYRITGKVQLAAGLVRSIPFEEHGSLSLH